MPMLSEPEIEIPTSGAASGVELSILMPCLNEAETLAVCIEKAQRFLRLHGVSGEVVIADNGSTDGSQDIARRLGARVVPAPVKGYGAALSCGTEAARGKYIIMGDSDDSYDFSNLMPFVEKLRQGYDLVMGNRFKGGIQKGAMPPLHRYLGNPVLTAIGRVLFHSPCGDFHCGLRGFRRQAILDLNLQTTGMEFASEMVVKATLSRLPVAEVPTTLAPDGRSRPPHLRSWRDGWRHLRFMLLYCPRWLFLYPGMLLTLIGLLVVGVLLPGPRTIGGVEFDVHTMMFGALAILVGYQTVLFAVFTKTFAIAEGLLPADKRFANWSRHATLEVGLVCGLLLVGCGLAWTAGAVGMWQSRSFGALEPGKVMRWVIPAVISIAIGVETIFASFFLSVLGLSRRSTK